MAVALEEREKERMVAEVASEVEREERERALEAQFADFEDTLLEPSAAEREPWRVRDLSDAVWAFGKVKRLEARKREIRDFVAKRKARLDAWEAEQCAAVDKDVAFFAGHLEGFMRFLNRLNPRQKFLDVLDGRIGLRMQGKPKRVLPKEQDGVYRMVTENGEVLPGIVVLVETEPRFYMKVAEAEEGDEE